MLAGWKLKNRKPRMLPSRIALSKATGVLPVIKASTIMVRVAMADTPAAKPSRPSIRLTALVTPTTHSTVIAMPIQGYTLIASPKGSWI
ncbi:hypothetical protein D3C76_1471920 [compost metagenome]